MSTPTPRTPAWGDTGWEERMKRLQRLAGRVEQCLRQAGFRGYPDGGDFNIPGFMLSPVASIFDPVDAGYVKVQYVDRENVDWRPKTAEYAAALEAGGLRCEVVLETDDKDGSEWPSVRVYQGKE